jgi:hypothetical protein
MAKRDLKEFKASFGVRAEVPEPTAKRVTPPGGAASGEEEPVVTSPTAVKPSKGVSEITPVNGSAGPGADGEKTQPMQGTSKIKQPPQVTKEDVDVSADLEAIFNGLDLTDDFKSRAKNVFETAVVSIVNAKLSEMSEESEVELRAIAESINDDLVEKIDSYLDYVVEQWMEDNTLAVTSGLRTEIAESLIDGIKRVFEENYVTVPEDRVDIVDELATKVEELEDALSNEIHENVSLREEVERWQRDKIVSDMAEGLSDSQVEKLRSLSEAVEYETKEQFAEKVEELRESYFTEKKLTGTKPERVMLDEQVEIEEEKPQPVGQMAGYVAAISRTIKK